MQILQSESVESVFAPLVVYVCLSKTWQEWIQGVLIISFSWYSQDELCINWTCICREQPSDVYPYKGYRLVVNGKRFMPPSLSLSPGTGYFTKLAFIMKCRCNLEFQLIFIALPLSPPPACIPIAECEFIEFHNISTTISTIILRLVRFQFTATTP